ncbi:UDP-N-acetylmuramate dehydrogenase [Acetivibrio clariflavus]|uniref:UDP-N-acetylenolpyruvoylglucosamine reductase n=1 Tax=Acetivibrio clariflavus (strain DSM 19732 / NBRC 101661 / EBR45) TaxID=720554 RepID=G8LY75_ACECE|nr:UDP-N-acetylmuramate dehydrogenase [Acetivibrio clariflavus]AEV67806.1 UDP-N-acetylmuramate dehydrogenase [Acetivibrio clariflavus DSM 19732]
MEKGRYIKLLGNIAGEENVKVDEPMRNHTSFKIGGPADFLVTPCSVQSLCEVIKLCKKENLPIFIMGNGTNLLVSDKGIRGVVVKIYDNLNWYVVKENCIEAYGGILLSKLSDIALENELTGLEFASGIPGTLGGAVAMNAGAYGGEMKDVVVETEFIDKDGNLKKIKGEEHQFGYRTSFIQKQSAVAVKSVIKLKKGERAAIKALIDDLTARRQDKQPLEMPSAGSVFKRPEGYFAGKLIEDCGLRGFSIGGAQVSEKHCGFIVNKGNATSKDILDLIRHIQKTVREKFGVELQTEIKIVGDY